MSRKQITPILLKLFPKVAEGGIFPDSFCDATITLTPKPKKDITKKIKLQANITDELGCKNPDKILANRIQQHLKGSHTMINYDPKDARILEYMQINQCDTPYKQNER